jgi:hypothetical protein
VRLLARTISLFRFLKDAEEDVRKAAAEALNKAADELKQEIKNNMARQGIQERTGNLIGSIKATKATPDKLIVNITSEVYAKAPKRPGLRNPAMKGRYKYGVPYGRIIEFSPRINKPFFFTAWYLKRKYIKEDIIEAIGEAWNKE